MQLIKNNGFTWKSLIYKCHVMVGIGKCNFTSSGCHLRETTRRQMTWTYHNFSVTSLKTSYTLCKSFPAYSRNLSISIDQNHVTHNRLFGGGQEDARAAKMRSRCEERTARKQMASRDGELRTVRTKLSANMERWRRRQRESAQSFHRFQGTAPSTRNHQKVAPSMSRDAVYKTPEWLVRSC